MFKINIGSTVDDYAAGMSSVDKSFTAAVVWTVAPANAALSEEADVISLQL